MKVHLNGKAKAAIAVIVVAIAAVIGYRQYQEKQEAAQESRVETVTVSRMDLKSTVSATGTIHPIDSVEVSSRITARLKTVNVKENDQVKAGQVLATLDAKDYEAKRDQAQYKVTNAKAEYDRVSYLYSIGADTQKQVEDAQMNYDTAVSALTQASSDADETNILAPIDGTVVGEPKTVGTMAVATSDNPTVIMRIANLSSKEIKAKVDETDIGNIAVGQPATFTVDAFTDKTFTARVKAIAQTDTTNSWDTTSSTTTTTSSSASVIYYYVTLAVDDPENLLLPAMTARVDIHTADRPDALAIPLSALKTDTTGSYVVILNSDGTQENRYVETGIYSDEYVEILSGLEDGEKVVNTSTVKQSTQAKQTKAGGGPPRM